MNPDDDPKDDGKVLDYLQLARANTVRHSDLPAYLREPFLSALRRGVIDFDEATDCYMLPARPFIESQLSDSEILARIAAANGAILVWQVGNNTRGDSFVDALDRGVILFDADADCYVHPAATRLGNGAYTMKGNK